MSKDPAFLFYTSDFYLGTRTMLPEERACFIDLLIYQHQNGIIPLDLERVKLFATGIAEATLIATLEAKFERTPQGWLNRRLKQVTSERQEYKSSQSINGTIGAFFKKAKASLNKDDYERIKLKINKLSKKEAFDFIEENQRDPLRVAQAMLKHIEIENEIENEIEIENENRIGIISRKDFFEKESDSIKSKSIRFLEEDFDYVFTQEDSKFLDDILSKIKRSIQKKKKEEGFASFVASRDEIFLSFKFLIENLPDWIRQNKFQLDYISKKYNEIYQAIKTQKNGSSTKISDAILAELGVS